MDHNQEVQYSFCPKCGALTKNGVCGSCGAGSAETEVKPGGEQNTEAAERSKRPYEEVLDGFRQQQQNSEWRAYSDYANNGIPVNNGAIPPDKPVKNGNGKVVAIVFACVGLFLLLIILLGITVFRTFNKMNAKYDRADGQTQKDRTEAADDFSDDWEEPEASFEDKFDDEKENNNKADNNSDDREMIGGKSYGFTPEDDYYKELRTVLREDLSYSVAFETASYKDGNDNAEVFCEYPVLGGDIPNRDYLNDLIYTEYTYYVEFYEQNLQGKMDSDAFYNCVLQGYVTYMDEDKLSIVFGEDISSSYYYLNTLFCINIDVKNGTVLNNTEIIDATDKFSIDFRIRESEQNQSDTLDWYTDQQLTEMLNDSVGLIVFYTPLGLEVGINHDYGWSTATYKDYEQYLKSF